MQAHKRFQFVLPDVVDACGEFMLGSPAQRSVVFVKGFVPGVLERYIQILGYLNG